MLVIKLSLVSEYRFLPLSSFTVQLERRVFELIREYNKNPDRAVFESILLNLDGLIARTILKCKSKFSYLKDVDEQDCYQDAVLAVYDVLNKIASEQKASLVPAWIVAYVKARLRKVYRYRDKELSGFYEAFKLQEEKIESFRSRMLLEGVLNRVCSDEEKELFRKRFFLGMRQKDIAKQEKVTESAISQRMKEILRKLRKVLKKERGEMR